jgi:hypothetical protein
VRDQAFSHLDEVATGFHEQLSLLARRGTPPQSLIGKFRYLVPLIVFLEVRPQMLEDIAYNRVRWS